MFEELGFGTDVESSDVSIICEYCLQESSIKKEARKGSRPALAAIFNQQIIFYRCKSTFVDSNFSIPNDTRAFASFSDEKRMEVTSLSWSTTGGSIAVAYGSMKHMAWGQTKYAYVKIEDVL